MIDFGITRDAAQRLLAKLTPQETKVAERIAMGDGPSAAARQLGLSTKTVDIHLTRVRKKLGIGPTYGIGRIWFAAKCVPG